MKKLCLLLMVIAMSTGIIHAAEKVRVPETVLISFDKTLTADSAKEISKTGKMPDGSQEIKLKKPERLIHLSKVKKDYEPIKGAAVVYVRIEADEDCVQTFGAGCDWWFTCFINGEQAGTTEPNGNYHSPVTSRDHFFTAQLKKGVNHAALFLRPGYASWDFAFDTAPDFDLWPSTEAERDLLYQRRFPREKKAVKVIGIPVVHHVTRESASFAAAFDQPVAAGVKVWKKGQSAEKIPVKWTMSCGIRDCRTEHNLTVTDLKPDTAYEYDFIVFDESKVAETVCRHGEFTTFPVKHKDHTLAIISDTQVTEKTRSDMLNRSLKNGLLDSDVFVSLGDMDSNFDDFTRAYFTSALNALTKQGYGVPFLPLRGNHEFRGHQTGYFEKFFGRPYGHFSFGDTLYIMLDTGEDKPVVPKPDHYTLRTDTDAYFREQGAWLKALSQTDEFKNAKRRIVLAHSSPFCGENKYMAKNIETIAGDVFYGKNAPYKLDLWVCGHTHAPYRFDPVTGELTLLIAKKKMKLTKGDVEKIVFPVYVNDGSFGESWQRLSVIRLEVTDKAITLSCIRPDGKVIDKIRISDGKPFEVLNIK